MGIRSSSPSLLFSSFPRPHILPSLFFPPSSLPFSPFLLYPPLLPLSFPFPSLPPHLLLSLWLHFPFFPFPPFLVPLPASVFFSILPLPPPLPALPALFFLLTSLTLFLFIIHPFFFPFFPAPQLALPLPLSVYTPHRDSSDTPPR